jgi:hypothetical protein
VSKVNSSSKCGRDGPNRTLTEVYSAAMQHPALTDNYKAPILDHSSYVVDHRLQPYVVSYEHIRPHLPPI